MNFSLNISQEDMHEINFSSYYGLGVILCCSLSGVPVFLLVSVMAGCRRKSRSLEYVSVILKNYFETLNELKAIVGLIDEKNVLKG